MHSFLSALILANKFLNDTAYPNKAWSEISGYPLRKINHGEFVVGEALEWRLWVGRELEADYRKSHFCCSTCIYAVSI